jgi:hypothetical protein
MMEVVKHLAVVVVMVAGCGRMGFDPGSSDDGADGGIIPNQDQSPTTGLVAYWGFEDLNTSGAMSTSSSDMAACQTGECPTPVAGALGAAASFNGVTSCLHIPSLASWSATELTLSAWVYIPSTMIGGDQPIVARNPDGCPSPGIQVTQGKVGFMFMGADTVHYHAWTSGVQADSWHQLGVRWDGTNEAVFVDGQCMCNFAPNRAILFAANEFTIGCDAYAATHAAATVDEIRIYSRSLADDEMPLLVAVAGRAAPTPSACPATCAITDAGPP